MAARSYLIVSDLHLADAEEHADGWKRHKSARFHFDDAFGDLVDRWMAEAAPGSDLTLVLNGDILDFDIVSAVPDDPPWPVSRFERLRGLQPTEPKSRYKLERMLADHPGFVRTLARVAAAGHTVVYVLGNHDREMHFPSLQEALRESIVAAARQAGQVVEPERAIRIEPWFFHAPGELYAEHGQQYDRFSSFRYILTPTYRDSDGNDAIAIPMGDVSCRYLLNRMGFFNPHASDFVLGFFSYLAHWAKFYAGKGRSLVRSWIWGSLFVLLHSLYTHRRVLERGDAEHIARRNELADRNGLRREVLASIDGQRSLPVTDSKFRLARELWLDRVAIAMAMTGATIALTLLSIPLWIQLTVPLAVFPLLFLIYESVAEEHIHSQFASAPQHARRIANLTGTRVVALGHTHQPMVVPLAGRTWFVNTGTWAPVWEGSEEQIVMGTRNYARIEVNGERLDVSLDSWTAAPIPPQPAELVTPPSVPVVVEAPGVEAPPALAVEA